jgi:hypothetical protein
MEPRQISSEELLDQVIAVLRAHCPPIQEDSWQSLGKPLFARLREMGHERKFRVWDCQPPGSYLWDVAWTAERNDAYWLELAGEIELSDMNKKSVADDFYKVLDAKAHVKLFLAATSQKMAHDLKAEVAWAIAHQRFRLPEEQIVVVLVTYDGHHATYHATTRIFASDDARKTKPRWETVSLGKAQ